MDRLRLFRRSAKRFRKDESASSTVEFVIVFPLFIAVVLAMFEAGWIMTKSMMLDRGTDLAMRSVRLGLYNNPTRAKIRNDICDIATIIDDCNSTLVVEMTRIDPNDVNVDWPGATAECYDRGIVDFEPTTGFNPGAPTEIMFVRVCALVDPIFPLIGLGARLPQEPNGGFRLTSYSAFNNEP